MTDSAVSNMNSTLNKRKHSLRFIIRKPTFFIGGYNGGPIIETILEKKGWLKLKEKNDKFNLAWTELLTQLNFMSLNPTSQLVNHIPNNAILTNKLGLLQSLRNYERHCKSLNIFNKFEMDDFTPKTFAIDDPIERDDFFDTFKDGDIWIYKPVDSNQGKGISLIRDINKFKLDICDRSIRNKNMWSFQTKITQRYITNPLLIEGRKFDIRCYMLIASTIPYLVLFRPGYIRLSINKYTNNDNNLITHLTNQFIQKQSPKYDTLKESTVWSIDKFNEYFNANYAHYRNFKENWVQTELTDNIKEILLHVFKSVKYKLANSVGFFELFGFDLMVDDSLKIWLIEANSNPSMNSSCELLKEIIPSILEEVLLIALECFEKNTKLNKSLLPLENIKKFEVLYCENFDLAKSRKSIRSTYKMWSTPIFKSYSFPPKVSNVSIPADLEIATKKNFSIASTSNKNDLWIDHWKKMKGTYKPSIGNYTPITERVLFHKEIYRTNQKSMSSTRQFNLNTLSGDSKIFESRIQQSLNLLLEKENTNVNRIISPTSINSVKSKNIISTSTKDKLKDILKNAN